MESRTVAQYASYIFHLIARLKPNRNAFARLLLLDETLDALAENPLLTSCVISAEVLPIEEYLSLRPERFDQLAALVAAGRIEIGAWYAAPDLCLHSLELTIRNLLLGLGSLRALGGSASVLPLLEGSHLQLPQIAQGFGIMAAVLPARTGEVASDFLIGLDGTAIGSFRFHNIENGLTERDDLIASAAGRHVLLETTSSPEMWLRNLKDLRAHYKADESFFSTWRAMGKLGMMNPPEIIAQNEAISGVAGMGENVLERLLLTRLEPLIVKAAYESPSHRLKNPLRLIQSLWRGLFKTAGKDDSYWLQRSEDLLALFPSTIEDFLPTLCQVEAESFTVTAIKLREDGQDGVIVRGYNPTGKAHWVKLYLWREFTRCAVVRADETPMGGSLPIVDKTITFMANPHRITTLWLR